MQIVIDNVAFSIQKIGGISVVWYELIKRLLDDKRFHTFFIEADNAKENYYRQLLPIKESKIFPINKKLFSIIRYLNPKLNIKEPYIYHSSYYRVSRDPNAINFTTVHDFTYEREGKKNIRSRIHIWQQKQAVMKSDVVICISENTRKDLFHYYKNVDLNKVHVVYNGVSDEYRHLEDLNSLELPYPPLSYCIYVGVRREYKNYNLAIEAAAKAGYRIVLIGGPLTEDEKHYLECTIGKDNYTCLSKVSNQRLNELYNGAFALLYPSSYEGFGIPCLEAQKAGCPVIAYNASSIPEVVCDPQMLIDELKVTKVVEKLDTLRDENYREDVVNKGVLFAKQFSWDRTYEQTVHLYEEAIQKRLQNDQ